jgi:hypothetical protein
VRLALPTLLLLATACGSATPKARYTGQTLLRGGQERFAVRAPPGWQQVAAAVDLAWRAPEGDAVIVANSTCRGHHDAPLSVLVNDLVIGTTDREVLLEEPTTLDGRAASHQVIALRLDGVPLIYDIYVVKKDGCVYDLTLISPPRAYERTADTFVAFVAGFRGLGSGPGE